MYIVYCNTARNIISRACCQYTTVTLLLHFCLSADSRASSCLGLHARARRSGDFKA